MTQKYKNEVTTMIYYQNTNKEIMKLTTLMVFYRGESQKKEDECPGMRDMSVTRPTPYSVLKLFKK